MALSALDRIKKLKATQDWRARHPEVVQAYNRGKYHERICRKAYYELKLEVFTHYCGGKLFCQCPGCRTKLFCFLQLDHIVPSSKKNKKKKDRRRGYGLWWWLKRSGYPPGFQVLCSNCNIAKRVGERCPMHGRKH